MKIKECQLLIGAFLAASVLVSNEATAQTCQELADKTKTECEAKGKKDVWYKSAFLGFNLTDGNSETLLLNVGGSADIDYGDDILHFAALTNYGEARNTDTGVKDETQNNVRADVSYKHLLNERLYLGAGTNFLHDNVSDIQYRAVIKPGLGYFVVKEDDLKLSFEAGPGYVFERVGHQDNDYLAPYVADRLDWTISKTAKFYQAAELLFDVDDSDNRLLTTEVGIEAALTSSVSIVTAIRDIYDNVPAEGRERNDLALITALKVAL